MKEFEKISEIIKNNLIRPDEKIKEQLLEFVKDFNIELCEKELNEKVERLKAKDEKEYNKFIDEISILKDIKKWDFLETKWNKQSISYIELKYIWVSENGQIEIKVKWKHKLMYLRSIDELKKYQLVK